MTLKAAQLYHDAWCRPWSWSTEPVECACERLATIKAAQMSPEREAQLTAIGLLKRLYASTPAKQQRARWVLYRAYRHLESKPVVRTISEVTK